MLKSTAMNTSNLYSRHSAEPGCLQQSAVRRREHQITSMKRIVATSSHVVSRTVSVRPANARARPRVGSWLAALTPLIFLVLTLLIFVLGAFHSRAAEGLALALDGVNDDARAAGTVFPDSTTLQSFTVEAWVYPTAAGSVISTDDAYDLILFYSPGAANGGVGIKFMLYGSGVSQSITEFRDVRLNQWDHVAGMYDASSRQFKMAINGILTSSPSTFSSSTFLSDPSFNFRVGQSGFSSGYFKGYVDELRVSDTVRYYANFSPPNLFGVDGSTRALFHFNEVPGSTTFPDSSGNGTTLVAVGGAQTTYPPGTPTITSQPVSQTVNVGQDASFAVAATGAAPLTYQWRKDGVNIVGATSNTYVLSVVQTNQAGSYTVVVSNTAGSVTSAPPAALTVNRLSQTIDFAALADRQVGDAPFNLGASASSGLAVSYSSSNPGVATVSGSTVTLVSAGTTTITAVQEGDATYLPATAVSQTLTINGPPVSLNARPNGNELIISWPTSAVGFILQSTLDLTAPITWLDFTNPPTVIGAQFTVTNSISGSAQFYRLRKP